MMPEPLAPLTAKERQTLRSVLIRELLSPPLAAIGPLVFRLLAQVEAQEARIQELLAECDTWRAAANDAAEERNAIEAGVLNKINTLESLVGTLRLAMPPTDKLRLLADWFDWHDDQTFNPDHEVQQFLRTWADRIDAAQKGSGDGA